MCTYRHPYECSLQHTIYGISKPTPGETPIQIFQTNIPDNSAQHRGFWSTGHIGRRVFVEGTGANQSPKSVAPSPRSKMTPRQTSIIQPAHHNSAFVRRLVRPDWMGIYTYSHTYIHAYIQACIRNHIHIFTYILTCMHTYMHTFIHAYIHAYIHTCIHTYIHTCIHTYIHIACKHVYLSANMHTYIRTYIHTCTHINAYAYTEYCSHLLHRSCLAQYHAALPGALAVAHQV